MARKRRNSFARCTLMAIGIVAPVITCAGTVQIEGEIGVGNSDNIGRTTENKVSSTMASLGARFSILQDTRRLTADVVGDLSWMKYSEDTYSSEVLGSVEGRLRFGLVEDRVYWTVVDTYGQTRVDLFSVPTPQNREYVNYFSTGPDLRFGLGTIMELMVAGRYTLVDYEESPTDTQRYGAWLAIQRSLSSGASLGANLTSEWVNPRGTAVLPSYDRTAVFLRYDLTGSRSSLLLDFGGNQVHGNGKTESGPLLRAEFGRAISKLSRLSLRAGREFTDSGNSRNVNSSGDLQVPDAGTGSLVQSSLPYISTYADLTWKLSGRRTTLDLAGGWYDEDYAGGNAYDRVRIQFGLHLTRALGARTQLAAGVVYSRSDYDFTPGDNGDITSDLALSWSLGRSATLELAGERYGYKFDSADSQADETRFWLRLRYGHRSFGTPATQQAMGQP